MAEQKFIRYGDRELELEPGMTLESAKELMARHFPELADPRVEAKKTADKTVYVFSKQAGTKGRGPTSDSAAITRRLLRLPENATMTRSLQALAKLKANEFPVRPQASRDVQALQKQLLEEADQVEDIRKLLADLPPVSGVLQGAIL